MQILTNTNVRANMSAQKRGRKAEVAKSETAVAPDRVTLSSATSEGSRLAASAPFVCALSGTGIGIGLAVSSAATPFGFFTKSLLGSIGGFVVGRVVADLTGGPSSQLLPKSFAKVQKEATTIGTVAGLGVGVAYALQGDHLSGGRLFVNTLCGALGGALVGSIVGEA